MLPLPSLRYRTLNLVAPIRSTFQDLGIPLRAEGGAAEVHPAKAAGHPREQLYR